MVIAETNPKLEFLYIVVSSLKVEKYKREEISILALKYTFLVQNSLKLKLLDSSVKETIALKIFCRYITGPKTKCRSWGK